MNTHPHRKRKRLIIFIIIGFFVLFLGFLLSGGKNAAPANYVTAKPDKGSIQQTVTASGNLAPTTVVTVGTQVSGPVTKVYVNFNDQVKKGQLLAEIDPSLQLAQIQQTEANLTNNESSMRLAEINAARLKRLYEMDYVSKSEWERADQEARTARTNYQVSKAQLERDRTNLGYAQVRSPVDGVVIGRDINEGQNIQASYQTPELFKIAQDLTKMQIDISLAEADVGQVKQGQRVTFTVDAYQGRVFDGVITLLKLNPTNQQGVVTYNAIVAVENPEKILLPGMTTYVNVIIEEKTDVLRVPNAALHYAPLPAPPGPFRNALMQLGLADAAPAAPAINAQPTVHKLVSGTPTPVKVTPGMSDDRFTEITSGELTPEDEIIVREERPFDAPPTF